MERIGLWARGNSLVVFLLDLKGTFKSWSSNLLRAITCVVEMVAQCHHGARPPPYPLDCSPAQVDSNSFIWFLQIFDRQKILAGKRIHSTKRLPPSTVSYSFYILSAQCRVESESIRKPEFFGELRKAEPPQHVVEMPESLESSQSSPPENDTGHPIATPTKSTPLIPVTEIKDGTQKSKPSVIEGDDNKQRRSPTSLRNSWDSSHYRHRHHRRHCHLPIKKVQKPPPETGDK
ncbi:hypothetical protein L6452_22737 [Arctium lappa]|uniref:Uncharacterized protein n=1 Tax=Arctium lappa TaxID=4217 RepID=A0ACB9B4Z3_ARCLA|nr:hypothetical protein L6452_22737 [Arctium lappa]